MYRNYIKRIIDLILVIVALPFWFIILLLVGPIIYFQDKGPIFYNAPRLGKDGTTFKMYKFRSMKINAPDLRNEDGSTYNAEDDLRLTNIGKFIRKTSLDETPQIINILKGEMSIVGPRPDLPEALNYYNDEDIYKLEAKPGITGYNQAYFRNSISQKEKFKNDIYYVNNISASIDFRIIIVTIINVIKRKNINKKEE